MNANAKKWIRALKSGRYKQTTGRLADNMGFCCLGVACEVAMKNGVKLKVLKSDGVISYNSKYIDLPLIVKRWLGMKTKDGQFEPLPDDDICGTSLADLNDNHYDFKTIADYIKKYKDQLFKKET